MYVYVYIDGLVQERRNSIANTLELRLSCTSPSIYIYMLCVYTHTAVLFQLSRENCIVCGEDFANCREKEIMVRCQQCLGWAHELCTPMTGPDYVCDICL